jgi:hypothetical protein
MPWIPLPDGNNAAETVRRLRAIDAEFFGSIYARAGVIGGDVTIEGSITGGDYISSHWDGGTDLSSGADGTATQGFFWDSSQGAAQLMGSLYMNDTGGKIIAGDISTGRVILNGGGYLLFDSEISSPLEEPTLWPIISIGTVDGDTFGSYPADTNASLQIRSPLWSGHYWSWIELYADNWTSGSNPGIEFGVGAASTDVQLGVGLDRVNVYSTLFLEDGSAAAPTLAFDGDTNTGMYRYAADAIGWTLGGTVGMYLERDSGTGEVRLHLGGESNDWIAYDPVGEYFSFVRQTTQEPLRLASAADGGNVISFDTSPYTGSVSGLMVNSGNSYTALQAYRETTTGANNIQMWKSNKTSTAATHAYVQADGDFYNTNGTYGTISDARLKDNIQDAPSYWDRFKRIRFTNYVLKADPEKTKLLNVVAQELEEIFPNLVKENEDKFKTVKNSVLYGPIAGSVLQEAIERIEALEERLDRCNCSI